MKDMDAWPSMVVVTPSGKFSVGGEDEKKLAFAADLMTSGTSIPSTKLPHEVTVAPEFDDHDRCVSLLKAAGGIIVDSQKGQK